MRPAWRLIPKILAGEKTVESRWYQTRRGPWDGIAAGDAVFFKDSGKPVTARARVARVLQLEIKNVADARRIVREHGRAIQIVNPDPKRWGRLPRYCVLVFLADPKPVAPFRIDKRGFGSAAAWLTVRNVAIFRLT